jgi:pimeloyl-ACP methyl ester carboxylesterase
MPFAHNDGIKIHYEVEGNGLPILFMHGFNGSLEDWRMMGFARSLGKDYRLILVDCRGRGDSDKPKDPKAYHFSLLISDLVAVLDDLNIPKTHYFGYSMGGRIGYQIPQYAGKRFSSLILGGAAYPMTGQKITASDDVGYALQKLEEAIQKDVHKPMEVFVAAFEEKLGPLPQERRGRMLAMDGNALVAAYHAFLQETAPDAREYLPKLGLPCLLYSGELDPRCPGVKETANLLAKATFFSLPGLNHFQAYAGSDLVVPHVHKFLSELSK